MKKENSLEKNAGQCPLARICFENYNLCDSLDYKECEYYKKTEMLQSLVNKSLTGFTTASQYNNEIIKSMEGGK